jgi:hypothetical protein
VTMQEQCRDGALVVPFSQALPSVLPSMLELQHLHVSASATAATPELANALSHLTALRSLCIESVQSPIASQAVTAIAPVRTLTQLQLTSPQ